MCATISGANSFSAASDRDSHMLGLSLVHVPPRIKINIYEADLLFVPHGSLWLAQALILLNVLSAKPLTLYVS